MNAPQPSAWLQRVALIGPGLTDWSETARILRGEVAYVPSRTVIPMPATLPASDRRRAGRVVRLAVGVAAAAAGSEASTLPTVFASSGGDGENCDALCAALATPAREVSPTRFMNSVHNAAAGYWGIGARVHEASSALCAHDGSAAAGLLDAVTQLDARTAAVMLVTYDADYPEPLRAKRPIPDAFAAALVMTRDRDPGSLARISLSLVPGGEGTRLAPGALEDLRRGIPAARLLPLLSLVARAASGEARLDYLDDLALSVTVTPA